MRKVLYVALCTINVCFAESLFAQTMAVDLSSLTNRGSLHPPNRVVTSFTEKARKGIRFSENMEHTVAWFEGLKFSNGIIELDIKGRDSLQKSFVGVAFHGANDSTFDAVYFRPFNFQATDSVRSIHAVQYVSKPVYTWNKLRAERNGVYEKAVHPAPNPNEWFHVKIVVRYPSVRVFVNGSDKPSLSVEQLSERKTGRIGLWVGEFSNGDFANAYITPE